MTIYIMTRTTTYDSTGESYTWASAHPTRAAALEALRAEMRSLLGAQGVADDPDTTAEAEIKLAFDQAPEEHDARLDYGDGVLVGDIFPSTVDAEEVAK